jgi:cell division protein FtsQ
VTGVPPRRNRSTVRAATLRAPLRRPLGLALPSGRSVALGLGLLALAVGLYVGARETSVFAVQRIEIAGGKPRVQAAVRQALRDEEGVSLVKVDPGVLAASLVDQVPEVESATVDRAFPHTLAVHIRPERAVAVIRRGAGSWVVSARGRVLRTIPHGAFLALPRVWLGRGDALEPGDRVDDETGARAVQALAPLRGFGLHPRTVRATHDEVTLVLRTGVELRLGDTGDLRLKFAIARRVLLTLGETGPGAYVDVSVPQRPVASANPQVGG